MILGFELIPSKNLGVSGHSPPEAIECFILIKTKTIPNIRYSSVNFSAYMD